MELKTGYKQTDVGVIPEDWEVKRLDAIAKIRSGGTPSTAQPRFWDGNLLWCTPTDITALKGRKYLNETNRRITPEGLQYSSAEMVPANSIVMTSRATIGECAINSVPVSTNQGFKNFLTFVIVEVEFLYYLLQTKKQDFISLCNGSTFLEIGKTQLSAFEIPLPPLSEQRAIARVLADTDALLNALDNLIAKKRDIKQAAMQQLLTGKRRLPGFSGAWETKKLGEVAAFYKGKGLPKSEVNSHGAEPCIHYGELFTKYPESISQVESRTNSNVGMFRSVANDVLMPTSDVTPNGLAKASCVHQSGVILGGDILVIRTYPNQIDGSFLSYVIRWQRNQIMQLVKGSTVYHLYSSDMKKFSFEIPSIEEQTAIARVLADMDDELGSLEKQREKTRALKQGMMQELLTGRIRLV